MDGALQEYLRARLTRETLEDLLRRGGREDAAVAELTVSPLTAAGENFGSVMAAVEARLRGGDPVRAVAKLLPMAPFLRDSFDCEVTVRKEVAFYRRLAPELRRLRPDLDLFPACLGARTGDGDLVDESAVILLEDLKARGFQTRQRLRGLDLAHAELALTGLGRLHALCVAVKRLRPAVFQDIVTHVAAPFHLGPRGEDDVLLGVDRAVSVLGDIPACAPHTARVRESLRRVLRDIAPPAPREPFSAIVHNDFWTNNMMFRPGAHGRPEEVKIVDFQITLHDSPLKDVLLFLHTSLEVGLRENSQDHLLGVYHHAFTDTLASVGVDAADFSLQALRQELDAVAPGCFAHIFFLHRVIFAEGRPDMATFSIKDFVDSSRLGELYRVRVGQLVGEFVRRGWI
ncbi:uncharacterized protein LOC134537031 [Bacillus rossius redtenbacheri]|uniref:uncharacterized protein LOC134537031 n=1 Tax=Bacillus rossius redtenbacheri TaxID=93214 RepID=UPI002FDD765E